jgi:hypothetical protein
MKLRLGNENPKKVVIAAVLLLFALYIVVRNFVFSPSEGASSVAPAASVATPIASATAPAGPVQPILGGKGPAQILPESSLDPRLRLDLLEASQNIEYKGNGRNIFRAGPEPPKPLPTTVAPVVGAAKATPAPPPKINLKFFGFSSRHGGVNKVFLAQGDDVFVAGEGDIVNRRYKILRVTPNSIEVEDVISNVRQTLPLTQG